MTKGVNNHLYINHVLGLTSTYISHEPGGSKYNPQETVGSTSDSLTLIPTETCPKYNFQEPVGSIYDRLTLVLKNICYILTQNIITVPFINTTYETYITQSVIVWIPITQTSSKYIDIKN